MPHESETINPQEVKNRSEKIITNAGGLILEWLPTLELPKPRVLNEIINRALVLNAMYQLHMNAPKFYIADWIEKNSLTTTLTPKEISILSSPDELTDKEHYELFWSLESLWAIAWATNLIHDLPFNDQVGSELANLSPNLQLNENGYKYKSTMKLRPIKSIYEMLDLYYRLHWWIQTSQKENKSTGDVLLEVVIERRKALEWIINNLSEWDNIDLSI